MNLDQFNAAVASAEKDFDAIQKAADKTGEGVKKTEGFFSSFGQSLLSGVGIGAGFSLATKSAEMFLGALQSIPAAIAAWTSHALDAADKLSNLATTTGVSAEGLQRLERLGAPAGVSLETMARGALNLSRRLELTPKAFESLGFSVEHLKGLKPEQAFEEIAKAIGDMDDPGQQAAATMKLLGDRSGEMLRVIREGIKPVEDFGELSNQQVKDLDNLGDATGEAQKAWENLTTQLVATVARSPEILGFVKDLAAAVGGLAATVRDNGGFIKDWFSALIVLTEKAVPELGMLHRAMQLIAGDPQFKTPTWDPEKIVPPSLDAKFADLAANAEKFGEDAAKAQKQAEDAARKHTEELIKQGAAIVEAEKRVALMASGFEHLRDAGGLVVSSMRDLGQQTEIVTKQQVPLIEGIRQNVYETINKTKADEGLSRVTKEVVADMVKAKQITQEQADAFLHAGKAVGSFGASMKTALAGLGNVILGAIQGGGDIGKAVGSSLGGAVGEWTSKAVGKTLSDTLGKTLGGALSSVLPGLGALIGSVLGSLAGKVGGWIGGLFGNKEIKQVNQMRDAFFEAHGGFEKLAAQLDKSGQSGMVKKIFDAKTVAEFNALVGETQGLLDMQGKAQEDLNAAVEKYGFTVDELGPKWKQQELDKQAGQLIKEYELLTTSGIDVNTVISKMGPNFSTYVDTAVKSGVAIPEAMHKTITALYEQGKLVHENGDAFTEAEYDALSFTQTLSEGLAQVVDQIKQLVAALTGGIPRNLPPIHQPIVYDDPGRPNSGENGSDAPRYASGTPYVPRTGLAVLHQGEAVIPASENVRGGVSSEALLNSIEGLRREFPDAVARAVLHAVQTGSR
jgi:hypothetical protein